MRFTEKIFLAIVVATLLATAKGNDEAPIQRIRSGVEFLASDELKGRAIGSPEIDRAAEFIAEKFAQLGLKTAVFEGSPYQEFEIAGGFEPPSEEGNQLEFIHLKTEKDETTMPKTSLVLDREFRPLAVGGSGEFESPVVFVGYGITFPEENFDEYANVDVQDKVVVILRKEPQQSDTESIFNGDKPSNHAFFATKIRNAIDHGAKAIILVNDYSEQERNSKRQIANWQRQAKRIARILATGPDSDSVADFQKHRQRVERLTAGLAKFGVRIDEADKLLSVSGAGRTAIDDSVPVLFCQRAAVRGLIENATQKTLEAIEHEIDRDLTPQSIELSNWTVRGKTTVKRKSTRVKNVLAVLDGEGDLADETIIIGAHYDHVGMGGVGSLAPWTNEIHNGADDNASGVVALLEVARQITQAKSRPRRRIVFIAFTAEESGLLGSKHYVDHPRFALKDTVAMLNLDMVGRIADRPLEVNGVGTSARLEQIVDTVSAAQKFAIKKSSGGNGPSDHATFNAKKIPVLHFFSGLHSDYHRPGDDVDKIDFEGIARVSTLTARIVLEIDRQDQRLIYKSRRRVISRKKRGFLGVQVTGERLGCRLTNVVKASPAAKVGLVRGDVLTAIDGQTIESIGEMLERLDGKSPGDEVTLTVLHEKAQQTFKVELGESR